MKHSLLLILILPLSFLIAQKKEPLLNITKGQLPNDTALDNKSTLTLQSSHPQLPGKIMKVEFAKGDTFGMTRGGVVQNWDAYDSITFSVFNPASQNLNLAFVVKHHKSKNYQTRIDIPIRLKSGKNDILLRISEMTNVNGSRPDLSDVRHWYLANQSGSLLTLYFTDIMLVG